MDNLKNLRKDLRAWGRYWASKETVGGYASKSNVERLRECCELGGVFSSDAHLFSHGSQGIKVPKHIEDMTKRVNQLSDNCRKVITGRYVKGFTGQELRAWTGLPEIRSVEFWLLRAESNLLS